MKALQIEAFGNPAEVVKAVDIPDVGAPAAGEVVVALEASPINQYDLLMIAGGYGYRPRLPAIMGTEGVGRVVAVGAGVQHLKEGDRTLVPFLHPTWAERIKTDASWLRPLPPGDINQFAMMGVNSPTAYLLLTDIVKLPRGSWVLQNGANSGVGRATVAIARSLGLRTINVVRRDEVVAEMKALGGDVVLVDGPDLARRVAAATANAPIALALDGVSDTSPMNLMSCLSESGVLVSYGGTSRKPMVVNPGQFIFKKQTIRGFWLLYWYQSAKPDEITAMFDHLAPLIAAGTISAPVAATYGFGPGQRSDHEGGRERWQGAVPSAPVKDDLVAEPTQTVIGESRHARSHVVALEERRRHYDRYLVHGGDFGAAVAEWIALDTPEHLLGIHAHMIAFRHAGPQYGSGQTAAADATPDETAFVKAEVETIDRESAYFALQLTRPETLSYALTDSPVGWAAYMLDKWQKWTDLRARPFEAVYDRDRVADRGDDLSGDGDGRHGDVCAFAATLKGACR